MASVAVALGWDLRRSGGVPLRLFLRPRALWMGQRLDTLTMYPAAEAGLTWTFAL
jgi:hypothetical protein